MSPKHSGTNLQGKKYIRNCICYTAEELLGHGMKKVERVLESVNLINGSIRKEQLMLCLSWISCKKSIVLKKKAVYVFCGLRESI